MATKNNHTSNINGDAILYSILSILALNIDLNISQNETLASFFDCFKGYSIVNIILLIALYFFFKCALKIYENEFNTTRSRLCCGIPSGLFTFFMIFGYSFKKEDSWSLIFKDILQIWKCTIATFGYYILFFCSIVMLFHWINKIITSIKSKNVDVSNKYIKKYLNSLVRYPFRTSFITLLICYLPILIISYPATFMGDTRHQIVQAYNPIDYYGGFGVDVSQSDIKIYNHHPVVHTMIIHGCLVLGTTIFKSYNVGIFIYILLQSIFMFAVMSYLIQLFIKLNFSPKIIFGMLIYFILSPRIENYMTLVTKDVFFAGFVVLYIISLYYIQSKSMNAKRMALFVISMLGVFLFRNDGKYIIIISLIICLLLNKNIRKLGIVSIVCVAIFSSTYSKIILPSLGIASGSVREMLSIPFQQTARYIRDYPDEITPEEKESISAVFNYDKLAKSYDPDISDPVKNCFYSNATSEDLKQYFSTWLQMLFKHPSVYIEATMDNTYKYFYPDTNYAMNYSYEYSEKVMVRTNESSQVLDLNFYYPENLRTLRTNYQGLRESLFKIPILSILLCPSTYTWIFILWCFYCIKIKDYKVLSYTAVLGIQVLIFIAGPTNGVYFRYLYPFTISLPTIILLGMNNINKDKYRKEIKQDGK